MATRFKQTCLIKSEVSISSSLSFFLFILCLFVNILWHDLEQIVMVYLFFFVMVYLCSMFFWNLCSRWRMMWRIVVRSVTSERGSQNPTVRTVFYLFLCVFFLSILSCMNRKQIVMICSFLGGLKMAAYVKNRRSWSEPRERGNQIPHCAYGQTFHPPTPVVIFDRWWRNHQPPSFFRW